MGADLKVEYSRVPTTIIKRYGSYFPFDIYLKLSERKIIKISNKEEDIRPVIEKYEKKGLQDIYVIKKEYLSFVKLAEAKLKEKFVDEKVVLPTEENVMLLNDYHELIKENFMELKINSVTIDLCKTVAKVSLKMAESAPNLALLYKEFKKNCSEEYLRGMMIGYLLSIMSDQFEWRSKKVKENLMLASFLCDITLLPEDFAHLKMHKDNTKNLNEKLLNHPLEIKQKLSEFKEAVPRDVLTIIGEHHEKADGRGFPLGLKHSRINVLTATFQVATNFFEQLEDNGFNNEEIEPILAKLAKEYTSSNFRKAYQALRGIFLG